MFNIPIRIRPIFFALILFIGWASSSSIAGMLIWAAVMLISVLVHEYGHALTAVAFKQRAQIELFGMGGMTLRQGPPLEFWQEFIIVLNGPLASIALGFFAYALDNALEAYKIPSILSYILGITFYVNIFWSCVNLLPVLPLDGGQLLRIVLEKLFGIRGLKITLFVSMLAASSLTLIAFMMGELFIGSLFFLFTFESFRNWKSSLEMMPHDKNQNLQNMMKEAERDLQRGMIEESLKKCQQIREISQKGVIYLKATQNMVKALVQMGKYREAYDLLSPLSKKLSVDALISLQQLAYRIGKWDEAIAIGTKIYQQYPSYDSALINSLSHAILGQEIPAIGWLKTSIEQGLPNVKEVLNQREFDHLRDNPQFHEIVDHQKFSGN